METQTDRQCYFQNTHRIIPSQQWWKTVDVINEKIVILENKKDQTSRENTTPQNPFSSNAFCFLNVDAGSVINDYRQEKNQNIFRDEEHIKHTTGDKQNKVLPTRITAGNKPKKKKYNRKKYSEFEWVE